MSLSTNKGMSAVMGSQPCLQKAMQMMTLIQQKDDSPCHVCAHRPMCRAGLKSVTTYPPTTHTFLKWSFFLTDFKKKYTHTPPYVMTCLHIKAKLAKKSQKSANRHKIGSL